MSKHTPGPWEVLDDRSMTSVVVEYGEICDIVQDARPVSENLANARLIAAAPEMLEALEKVVSAIAIGYEVENGSESAQTWARAHDEMLASVNSALKKARGDK